MAEFELVRVAIRPEGAFGVLKHNQLPFIVTLERTFAELKVIIPPGLYVCRSSYFHGGGYDTYEITGVAGHDLLKFHWGNWETDSTGCILTGRRFGEPRGKPGIFDSKVAFEEFMRRTGGRPSFELEVRAAA